MPLKRCSSDGKSGWKWGDSGKCYTGPGARKKALKQGQAIEINKKKFASEITMDELEDAVSACYDAGWSIEDINMLQSTVKATTHPAIEEDILYTQVTDEHYHRYYPGDTMTSWDYGHAHPIVDGKVQQVQGHTHG